MSILHRHLLTLLLPALLCSAAPPAAPPASQPATQPTVDSVLADLTSSSYATRQAAQENLYAALARQTLQMATATDPETTGRLRQALADQEHLIHWTLDALPRLGDTAPDFLRYCLSPQVEPALRNALSSNTTQRDQGLANLMALKGQQADLLLGTLISDPDSNRACTVIDALFDRQPSDDLSLALLDLVTRRLKLGSTSSQRLGFKGKNFTLKDRWVQPETPATLLPAALLLAKYKSPAAAKAFQAALPSIANFQNYSQDDSAAAFCELAIAFKSDAVTEFAYTQVIAGRRSSSSGTGYFSSNRTPMIALYLILTDQSPKDFGVVKGTPWDPQMWATGSEDAEEAAVAKIKESHDKKSPATAP